MRVVIVDDSRTERMWLRRVLRDEGYDVVGEAENGAAAIAICARLRPDVVLLDVAMRGMNGDEAARKIRDAGTARHIIIASSNVAFLRERFQAEGFGCVNKPHDAPQVLQAIEELTRGESLARSGGAPE